MTRRAERILGEVRLIAAEDTRSARVLLSRFAIRTPVTSYFEHNKEMKMAAILRSLEEGDVALISEAGMPALCDPGYELVQAALKAGHEVVPIPGPAAVTTALVVSGLPTQRFLFLGFFPRREVERRRLLTDVAREPGTLVAYEAPHRLVETLADVSAVLGNRQVAVAEELTKKFERVWRGEVAAAITFFAANPPRGEFTLVIAGAPPVDEAEAWPDERVTAALAVLEEEGVSQATAVRALSRLTGRGRREIYRLALGKGEESGDERSMIG
jgi:16S rRNA (cytidine1402-2'-O)-methyltransferase